MNRTELNKLRTDMLAQLLDLDSQDTLGENAQRTVVLDQQSVGRLNRMDAMQHQAMAKATQHRRNIQKSRITATLARIEADEFGYCVNCGEAISPKRIELDPTVPTCVDCASS